LVDTLTARPEDRRFALFFVPSFAAPPLRLSTLDRQPTIRTFIFAKRIYPCEDKLSLNHDNRCRDPSTYLHTFHDNSCDDLAASLPSKSTITTARPYPRSALSTTRLSQRGHTADSLFLIHPPFVSIDPRRRYDATILSSRRLFSSRHFTFPSFDRHSTIFVKRPYHRLTTIASLRRAARLPFYLRLDCFFRPFADAYLSTYRPESTRTISFWLSLSEETTY
jgi:hypothetical protein